MKEINVSILGTGMIVPVFIDNAKQAGGYHIRGIWGRNPAKAETFSEHADYTTGDLSEVLNDPVCDAVYIALPNSLHAEYAKQVINAGKHVLVEKPFAASYKEAEEVIRAAEAQGVTAFDMCMTPYHPNYVQAKKHLSELGEIRIVSGILSHYSRRYDRFKAGEILPVFDRHLAGGTLMDLGIYLIRFVHGYFGMPDTVHYHANILHGIDTSGILVLDYSSFKVSLTMTKDAHGPSGILIQGDAGSLSMEGAAGICPSIRISPDHGEKTVLPGCTDAHYAMQDELDAFRKICQEPGACDIQIYYREILEVQKVLDLALADAGITFKEN